MDSLRALQKAIIVDVDGTVANMGFGIPGHRGPFDWDRVGEDEPIQPIIDLVSEFRSLGYVVLYVSGRSDTCRLATWNWLVEHCGATPGTTLLYMRRDGDYRDDAVVKYEIYHDQIADLFDVRYVLDDRNKVVQMWRSIGLTCLQVAAGDF